MTVGAVIDVGRHLLTLRARLDLLHRRAGELLAALAPLLLHLGSAGRSHLDHGRTLGLRSGANELPADLDLALTGGLDGLALHLAALGELLLLNPRLAQRLLGLGARRAATLLGEVLVRLDDSHQVVVGRPRVLVTLGEGLDRVREALDDVESRVEALVILVLVLEQAVVERRKELLVLQHSIDLLVIEPEVGSVLGESVEEGIEDVLVLFLVLVVVVLVALIVVVVFVVVFDDRRILVLGQRIDVLVLTVLLRLLGEHGQTQRGQIFLEGASGAVVSQDHAFTPRSQTRSRGSRSRRVPIGIGPRAASVRPSGGRFRRRPPSRPRCSGWRHRAPESRT